MAATARAEETEADKGLHGNAIMNPLHYLGELTPRTRRAFGLGVGLALCVLAGIIFAGWLLVRTLVRQQIAQRDAEALYATTLMEQLDARAEGMEESEENDAQLGFDAAILASRLKGVMGIRFFNPDGEFTDAFPGTIHPQALDPDLLSAARRFAPQSRFRPETPLSEVFIYLPQFAEGKIARLPILEVTVPLHAREGRKLAGAAQFIVEGQAIVEEYRRLDRHLAALAGLAFVVAGLLLAAMLWPAFRQVEQLNQELTQRNERLRRANEELALAARASALGAISAHLMHGLKNPLASLSQFVHSHGARDQEREEDWQDALTAARRMQSLVEQTLEVLSDARGAPAYEISLPELAGAARERVASLALSRKVELVLRADASGILPSRAANLVSLILVNLLQNAIEATPQGKQVTLFVAAESGGWRFRVQDQGPGFPAHLRESLFLPCRSTREGGSGIGLAICKQLADHLGASLVLEKSGVDGCVFALGVRADVQGH